MRTRPDSPWISGKTIHFWWRGEFAGLLACGAPARLVEPTAYAWKGRIRLRRGVPGFCGNYDRLGMVSSVAGFVLISPNGWRYLARSGQTIAQR